MMWMTIVSPFHVVSVYMCLLSPAFYLVCELAGEQTLCLTLVQ